MRLRNFGKWSIWMLAAAAMIVSPNLARAQTPLAGVAVDADGVLRTRVYSDPTGQLMHDRVAAAKASLDRKVANYSKLRMVSLNRLEQAIIDSQGSVTDEMRFLAGLQRVRYVFYYPESKDIVLAGPAEGWVSDLAGRTVGITSGRPVIQLQDVVVALRAFPSGGRAAPLIGCSIDPTSEGLSAMQEFQRKNRPNMAEPQPFAEALRNSLGNQLVSVNGVSPKTRFSQVMVEADYRMKLIGIGLERPPVKLASYVDLAKPGDVAREAMQRWYFLPDYQCVRQSEDGLAMELVGNGVKLVGEDEVVTAGGKRRAAAGKGNRASQAFVRAFTKEYPELAERSPVYADLRNLIDLAVAAAFIQKQDYCAKAGWKMEFFGSEKTFAVETYDIPKMVETAINVVWKGSTLMTPIGGGVEIRADLALDSENLLEDKNDQVAKVHEAIKPELAKGQWWWD